MRPPLPYDIRPLRPVVPEGRLAGDLPWEAQPFEETRGALEAALGPDAQTFAAWLAELYWRACSNVWPLLDGRAARASAYRRVVRCGFLGAASGVSAALRTASRVLSGGPGRKPPESGEALFRGPESGIRVFRVARCAKPGRLALAREASETRAFARWLYDKGLSAALESAGSEQDWMMRRFVNRVCGCGLLESETR